MAKATRREMMEKETCNKPKAFCKNVEDKCFELKTRTAEVEEGLKSALRVIGRAMAQNPDLANNRIGNVTVDTLVTELKNLLYKDLV